jgi:hypothetical protein
MNVGESVTVQIRARKFWNKTGIRLVAGQRHLMTSNGHWVDFFIPHGPDGDPSDSRYLRLFESKRRLPRENWFLLAGGLDSNPSTAFRIGSRCEYTVVGTGELTCFANDVPGFYWNNWGHVTLTVTCTG